MSEIDFHALNAAALEQCPALLEELLPGGKARGKEYVCGNLAGGEGSSTSVNLQTGAWADFATGEKGGDIVSLVAAIDGVNQHEAARGLGQMIGYPLPGKEPWPKGNRQAAKPDPIMPIPQGVKEPADFTSHGQKPAQVFTYRNQDGRILGYVSRFNDQMNNSKGKPAKSFLPTVYTAQGWKRQGFKFPYPFYGLDQLPKLPADAPIVIVEGEGKAAALKSILGENTGVLGLYGGSAKTAEMDYSPLSGRGLYYWPDNDRPGAKAALVFCKKVRRLAQSVKVINPPEDAPETWDCGNAVKEGWDRERLEGFILGHRNDPDEFERIAQKRWGINQEHTEGTVAAKQADATLVCVNIADFLRLDLPPREMIIDPVLATQGGMMIHAARGVGKTFVALSIAHAVASGGRLFGRWNAEKPRRVLILDGEMPAVVMQRRMAEIIAGSDSEIQTSGNLQIITPDLQQGVMPNIAEQEGQKMLEPYLKDIDLFIVDNLATCAGSARDNAVEAWLPVQEWLLKLRRRGLSWLLIHHQGKNGDMRGSSAKEDILDTVIALKRPADYEQDAGARFEVHFTKARGITGDLVKPFECQLATVDGRLVWTTRDVEDSLKDQAKELFEAGCTVRDVAECLGISKTKSGRIRQALGLDKKVK